MNMAASPLTAGPLTLAMSNSHEVRSKFRSQFGPRSVLSMCYQYRLFYISGKSDRYEWRYFEKCLCSLKLVELPICDNDEGYDKGHCCYDSSVIRIYVLAINDLASGKYGLGLSNLRHLKIILSSICIRKQQKNGLFMKETVTVYLSPNSIRIILPITN